MDALAPLAAPVSPAVDPRALARQGEGAPVRPFLEARIGGGAVVAMRLGKGVLP